ncbi:hypothetical protein TIFTF001_032981 [Ficus carica]|uniref:Uncharacterized protein n=1 Tax=Ficus carica TaxID=3494 RepID=A0AA88J7D3_FICCA|nr:hypothetical protein TIFTF001_032981 [Ficus carica]
MAGEGRWGVGVHFWGIWVLNLFNGGWCLCSPAAVAVGGEVLVFAGDVRVEAELGDGWKGGGRLGLAKERLSSWVEFNGCRGKHLKLVLGIGFGCGVGLERKRSQRLTKAARRSAMSLRESGSHSELYLLCILIRASEIRFERCHRPSLNMPKKEKATIDEGGKEISNEFEGIQIA